MQSKGAIRLVAILLAIACIWQLSFTAVSSLQEKKAAQYAEKAVQAFQQTPAFEKVADVDRAFVLDSISKDRSRFWLDSVSNEKVYFGYKYKDVKAKEINLGLDLKGGMNVMLQVQLEDLVRALAGENKTPAFEQALALAKERSVASRNDFITLFADAWKEVGQGERLATIFGTYEMRNRIKPESTDEQVIAVIREDAESAVSNSFNVLSNRIDRFGVTQPSIQKLGNSGRILVELPGVKEPERVRKLLQGTASLEFWTTYDAAEIEPFLIEANALLAQTVGEEEVAETVAEEPVAAGDSLLTEEIAQNADDAKALAEYRRRNPLFAVLQPSQARGNACIGYAQGVDTAAVNRYLAMPKVRELFPAEFRPMWSVKPSQFIQGGNVYELVAIKAASRDGKAPLDGGAVTDASVSYDGGSGRNQGTPTVSMVMNAEGANVWARLTKDNIGKQIAIVLDGLVYSYPTVQSEITGGNSQISGNFTVEEATDLTNVLKSGKLPAPAKIIQEQVVGPSLGARSIKAGMISFIIAFLLVLVYMAFFYQGAGLVADIALLCNVLFLFGTLVSFGAVLTLPGIALFIFGSGPVQGFATTLIIGIITSVLTSIFITRIIIDDRLARGKNITFENNITKNFLKNTKADFLGARKWSYLASGIVIVIALGSIFIKGFTYGVDFQGGRTYVVRFDQPQTAEAVRSAVEDVFTGDNSSVEVKQFGGPTQMKITTTYKVADESSEVDAEVEHMLFDALKGFFAQADMQFSDFVSTLDNPNGIISSDKVGPTIANDMKRDAIIAVIIALLVIFAYIALRFRGWTWGLGGVVSLAHTAIIVIGFFSLFSGILPFNLDVDQTFIAAILTIIGYAINDNVVIFDRIREFKTLHPNADFKTNVNTALNATLTRMVNTSVSTLLPMLAIAFFGGESIRGLSVALCLGIIIGTYASIMIGTPIMYDATISREKKAAEKK